MSSLKLIPTVVVVLLFSLFADAKIISKENYKYPIVDPDEATVASTGIHTPDSATEDLEIRLQNRKLSGYKDHRDLSVRFYPSPWPTKQLVFIISGIGGDTKSGYSKFLANQTQMRGVDAVAVPNVLHKNFIISSSTTGLVGGSAADGEDLYQALIQIKLALEAKGHRYDKVSLVGYSHGALLSAFIETADQRAIQSNSRNALKFDSALLINPPVDLLYALRLIDKRSKATKEISLKSLIKLAFRFHKLIGKFTKILTTSESHVEFSKSLKMTPEQRFAIIGKALSGTLPSAILASQAVNDLGVLPQLEEIGSVGYDESVRLRRRAAKRYSYEDYVLKFFSAQSVKTKSEPFSLDSLNQSNSLSALATALKSSKNIYLMHNMDDMLLANGQGYWLENIFGNRAIIYPTGGHLGNMWYPDNLNDYYRWLYYGRF